MWRKKLALLAVGTCLGLAAAEGLLRLTRISYPLLYQPDAHCGSRLRPGVTGYWLKEGAAHLRINRHGWRDREHEFTKPRGKLRIAVLGDSFAEALQVPREEAFWSVLESRLQDCRALGGRTVEVLNFGVSGYGTAQARLALAHYVWQYDPDVVLLAFFAANDVVNNSIDLETDQVRPFYVRSRSGLALDNRFRQSTAFRHAQSAWESFRVRAINRSRLLQLVWHTVQAHRAPAPQVPRRPALADRALVAPKGEAWTDAWFITEKLLTAIDDDVRRHGARFVVVTVPADFQVNPDAAERRIFARRLGAERTDYADLRVEALGRDREFLVIPLAEKMLRYAERQRVYLYGFDEGQPGHGHWNRTGHRLAGEWIADALCGALADSRRASRLWETPSASAGVPRSARDP